VDETCLCTTVSRVKGRNPILSPLAVNDEEKSLSVINSLSPAALFAHTQWYGCNFGRQNALIQIMRYYFYFFLLFNCNTIEHNGLVDYNPPCECLKRDVQRVVLNVVFLFTVCRMQSDHHAQSCDQINNCDSCTIVMQVLEETYLMCCIDSSVLQ
jgi:hypothetical protein